MSTSTSPAENNAVLATDMQEESTALSTTIDREQAELSNGYIASSLTPTPTNMSMEHIFFSLQHLESRISLLETEHNTTKEHLGNVQHQLPQMITTAEIDTRFSQLRNQMMTLQLAQQALHAQFQEVAASFRQVSCQWQEDKSTIEALRKSGKRG